MKKIFWVCNAILLLLLILAVSIAWRWNPPSPHPATDPISIFMRQNDPGNEIPGWRENDLSGWYKMGMGHWDVQNGILTCTGGVGYLATYYAGFTDIEISLSIRTRSCANSGVFFRASHPGLGLRPWPIGYESQIDHHDPKNPTGSLYNYQTASISPPEDEEWFTMRILAVGSSIQIYINDEQVVETTDDRFSTGFIALQAHDYSSIVEFKDFTLRIPTPSPH